MQVRLLTLFALVCCGGFLSAQHVTVIDSDATGTTLKLQLTGTELEFHNVELGGETATVVRLAEGHRHLVAGEPDVDGFTSTIIIDDQAATWVEVLDAGYYELTNVNVAPSKGNLYRNVDPATVPYEFGDAYSADAFFPKKVAELRTPFVYRDFRGQTVDFHPLQYNAVTGVLRIYAFVEIRVHNDFDHIGENNFTPKVRTTRLHDDLYGRHFANYGQYRYDVVDELGGILVIAHDQYMETIQPWVDWKIQKGHHVWVTDIADIGNSIENIQAHIDQMYAEHDISYVQLVGDEDQVTTELVINGGGPGYCDNCYGMLEGNDHMPEVMIARFLVHNNDELVPVIAKSIAYERTPDTEESWASTGINIGSNEGTGIGDDDEADWQHNNNLKQVMLDFTYTDVWEMYESSHGGDSPTPGDETADQSGNPNSSDVTDIINTGASLINYTGHGYHNGFSTSGFDGEDALALTNTKSWPYWIAVACCVGDFDENDGTGDCFGEKWLKATYLGEPAGGIGGSFSSVLQSWAPPMEGQDEMVNLIAEIGQQDIRQTFGGIHFHGSMSMVEDYGGGGEEMMDTWCVFGDGSAVMRTTTPVNLAVEHDAATFIGVEDITIEANLEDALISLTLDGQIIGTGLIVGGEVTITLAEPITDVVDITVTGTAFNALPYEGIITVLPLDGPWITDDAVAIDDAAGNGNDLADYAEDVLLDISLENVGIENAYGVEATLTTEDAWVVITDDYHNYGDINASNIVDAIGGYAFSVVDGVEDQHTVSFDMNVTDTDGNTWTPGFNVTLNAPIVDAAEALDVSDATGNGNGRLDNSETADLMITNLNEGHAATVAATGALTTTSPYVTINNPSIDLGVLAELGGDAMATFSVTVADDAPDGEVVEFVYTLTAGAYTATRTYTEVLNLIIEDWETGTDEMFDWAYDGDADWFITGSEVYEGAYAMQSGDIDNNNSTTLQITIDVTSAGPVEFARKTSTEGNYDFLYFRIDGAMMENWSGENDWQEFSYNLSTGTHTLEWTYEKDFFVSSGADACWVDDIILPPHNSLVSVVETSATKEVLLYPNPARDEVTLVWNGHNGGVGAVEVRNAVGQLVLNTTENFNAGQHRVELNLDSLTAGVYLVRVLQDGTQQTLRLIVE